MLLMLALLAVTVSAQFEREGIGLVYPHKVKDKAFCGNRKWLFPPADSLEECAAAVNANPDCGNGFTYGSDDKYCDCPT